MKRYRVPSLRFSIERVDAVRWMVVDWRYGFVKVTGKGTRPEQEQALVIVKAYFALHGDVNLLHFPKRLGTPPRWPAGSTPEALPRWREEQQEIASAYARLGVLAHGRAPEDVSTSPDFKRALEAANRVHGEALARLRRRVGLDRGRA